ncbi:MAG: alcohol dehydrogenase catalytic domain-containing protein [Armatimonadetes bacterium]|nr:alcohol dehydrogenase catalytic domain-containing protein [Armatimonadota bacterium]
MKILQITAPGELAILDVPIPTPGEGEVLMRIEAVSTCVQWDLHCWHNEPMFVGHKFFYPYTPGRCGHEATGTVEAVGPGVTGLAPGDRVSAWRDQSESIQGAYAHYYISPAASVIRVPEGLPAQALAPVEMAMCVGTVFRMLRDMNALQGRVFGATGLGPAGLIAIQMARAEGVAQIVGFDPLPARREMALRLGADACYDPAERPEALRLQTTVDCVGAKQTVEYSLDVTDDVVALFGVQREDYTYKLGRGGVTLCGYKGHFRESAEYAVDLIEQGKLNLAPLVTHDLPLERYGEGIALLEERKAIKICYWPWES